MADTTLSFNVLARDKASPAFDKVSKAVDRTEKKFGFLAARSHGLTAGMTAGFGKIVAAMGAVAAVSVFKGFIDEARESRKVSALTESIIRSTGGAAKISSKQVGALATAISNKTGLDDEAIQSGSNLLLTFKNVRNEVGKGANVFDRATQAAVDLSAAGFGDVNSASKMLGKALNDPLKGLTALGKAGVTFTEDQKKQIGTLVETGKTLEAQKIILKEVESQVGGAAAASADPMQKLGVIIGNVKETIGGAFLPIIDKAATWLGDKLPAAVGMAGKFFNEELLPPLKVIAGFVKDRVIPVVSDIVTSFAGLGKRLVKAIGPIDLGGIANDIWTDASKWAGKLIGGLKTGVDKGDWKPLGTAIGEGVVAGLKGAATVSGKLLDAIGALVDKVDWGKLGSRISSAITGLLRSVDWKKVGETLGDAIVTIAQKMTTLSEKLGRAFKEMMDKIDWQKIGRDSTTSIGEFISGVDWGHLAKVLGVMALKSLKINKSVYDSIVDSLADLVIGMATELGKFLGREFSKAGSWLKRTGGDLVSGLWSGITDAMKGVGGFIKRAIVDPVVNAAKSLFGIRSPSTVFAGIGSQLMAGLKVGLVQGFRAVAKWAGGLSASVLRNIGNTTRTLYSKGTGFLQGLLSGLSDKWKSVTKWISGLRASASAWLGDTSRTLYSRGSGLLSGLWSGLIDKWQSVTKWIGGLKASVSAWLGDTGKWLVGKGSAVLGGFLGGMVEKWKDVTKWVSGIATWIKDNKGPVSLDAKLLVPAGAAIMSGFLKGLKSGAGPAWNFVKSVGGKTKDALGAILFPEGGITGGLLEKVKVQGETLDVATLRALQYAQSILGSGFNIAQGSFEASSSYSGFTHTGGGAIDVNDAGMGWDKAVDALIKAGFAAWHRTPSQGPWGHHIHALLKGDPLLSPSARGQVADFMRGGDGLAGYKQGTPWVPNDQLAFLHKGEAVLSPEMNAARIRGGGDSGTTININVNGALDPIRTAQQIQQMLLKLKNTNRSPLGLT